MHAKLVQSYVDRARVFMLTDAWPTRPDPQWTALVNALVALADQRDKIVAAYDRENQARLADFHAAECNCLRCAVDAARAQL